MLLRALILGTPTVFVLLLLLLLVPQLRHVAISALMWGGLIGGAAFAAGFFGPMVFTPGANQGPMLGIFFTGPAGFLFGTVVGAIVGVRPATNGSA